MAKAETFLETVFDSCDSTEDLSRACFNHYDNDRYFSLNIGTQMITRWEFGLTVDFG